MLSFERLERIIEESYRQKAEQQKIMKAASQNVAALTSDVSEGEHRMAVGAVISPTLIEHVAKPAAESSEILKQQRKASEARGLAAPKVAPKR